MLPQCDSLLCEWPDDTVTDLYNNLFDLGGDKKVNVLASLVNNFQLMTKL